LAGSEEPAARRVERSLRTRPIMSWIKLGDVFYVRHRKAGVDQARAVIGGLRRSLQLDRPGEARVLEAAAIRARYRLAYADAFAVATALAHRVTLLTGDPEILKDGDPSWPVIDLRS
jgi:uncharacterized protein